MDFTYTHKHTHSKFTDSYYIVQDETISPIILHHNPEEQSMDVKSLSYLWLPFYSLSGDISTVKLENSASYIRAYI